jgi:hypothetical protein
MMEMRRRRHSDELIQQVVYENPFAFLSQSAHFQLPHQSKNIAAASRS